MRVHLDTEITQRVGELAARTGREPEDVVKEAILTLLEDEEDVRLAVERLESPARRWSLEEIENDVDV